MATFEDGSLVWSRSSPKQKFWPSIVFHSWGAASKAGRVPDGIAFLIDFGRKVDVSDADAAPPGGALLNMYLGEAEEWEFIPADESCVLPFLEHRDVLGRQRLGAQMKHHFAPALAAADAIVEGKRTQGDCSNDADPSTPGAPSKRPGVLLDFGTGTSFSSFAELWNYLLHNGWATSPGKGLASWHFIPPGVDPKKRNPVRDVDFFTSEDMVINHVRRTGLERPAPVTTVIKKSRRSSSSTPSQRTSSRAAEARPKPGKRAQSTTPVRSSGKRRSSSASVSSSAPVQNKSVESSSPVARSTAKVATISAAPAAEKSERFKRASKNRGDPPVRSEDSGAGSAKISTGANNAVDSRRGDTAGNGDKPRARKAENDGGRVELFFAAEQEQKGGDGDSGGGGGSGSSGVQVAKEAVAESKRSRQARRGDRQEEVHSGSKRSHGKTMQVEATNKSSVRASPNSTGDVTREAVTAKALASSPPAPSPSRRLKKRTSPPPTFQELRRLANKQIKHLRGLLAGTEQPFPGPWGLEVSISEITGFVKEAHNAWMVRQGRSFGSVSRARGALIVAGRSGTGKSTAFQAATRLLATKERTATLRYVTIKCAQLGENPNEVFSSVLAAVAVPSSRVDADSAREALSRLDQPSSFLTVLCLENAEKLKSHVLESLLAMSVKEKPLFAIVCLVGSLDVGEEIAYNQGFLGHDCSIVAMLGCKEDRLRAILGQSLGAAGPKDKDGEIIASLVNKGALDVIAKTVARVCGSVRIALNVCEVAFVERLRELDQIAGRSQARGASAAAVAAGPSTSSFGGADSAPGSLSMSPPSGSSSPNSGAGASIATLLTVAGAKAALNRYLVQRPEAVWGAEIEEQTPP